MDRGQQLADPRLEQPQRGRIRDHDGRGARSECGAEGVHVDAAVGRGWHVHGTEAGHGGGRRVRPVGRVGHEHVGPLDVAAAAVVGPNHEDAGQLALRTCGRLEGNGAHAADLGEHRLQLEEQLQRSLRDLVRRLRVQAGEAGQARGPFVELRVELHGA